MATQRINKIRSLVVVTSGAGLFFSGLSIYKGNEKFYEKVLMPAIRYLPPEISHNLAVLACKYKVFPEPKTADGDILATTFFNRTLSNPIGIAAGFDKQGEAVEGLQKLGFGFVEIGSVTPEPQPGNPKPRVFRLDKDEAIINRYGFNSDGHKVVRERLIALRESNFKGVLGVNLGKNKTSNSALQDYVQGVETFGPIADYLVINISSPNTPGLRDLQGKKDLEKLLEAVIEARNKLPLNAKVPLLLKLSPDLSKQDIKDIASVINKKSCRVDGLIVSNTTVARNNLKEIGGNSAEMGGLSGAPLRNSSTQLIADLFYQTSGKIPIVGVGGIMSGQDAFEKLEAGASYLQCYTAFIYHGPPVVTRIKNELAELIKANGYKNVQDVVGKNYKKYLNK